MSGSDESESLPDSDPPAADQGDDYQPPDEHQPPPGDEGGVLEKLFDQLNQSLELALDAETLESVELNDLEKAEWLSDLEKLVGLLVKDYMSPILEKYLEDVKKLEKAGAGFTKAAAATLLKELHEYMHRYAESKGDAGEEDADDQAGGRDLSKATVLQLLEHTHLANLLASGIPNVDPNIGD